MNLAWLSLAALLVAIGLSCATRLNIGLVAIPLAWALGAHAGMDAAQILAGFPVSLFVTLSGVMLLFSQAELNGTLSLLTRAILKLARGNLGWITLLFFALASGLSTLGAGAVAAVALLMPVAIRCAERSGIPLLLMTVIVGMGVNAGNLSPVSPVGVLTANILARHHLPGFEWTIYWRNFAAHLILSAASFIALGGVSLLRRRASAQPLAGETSAPGSLETRHYLTLAVILTLLVSAALWKLPIGLAAFAGALLLSISRAAPEAESIAKTPWNVVLMICGVSLLIALLEKTGGMALFAEWIAKISTPSTVHGVLALVTAAISTYSSTSGVVMPALLPLAQQLAEDFHVAPLSLVSSIVLGSHLVDVSPLSTIGAIAVAAVASVPERERLFNRLMLWSFSMILIAALASWLFFSWQTT
jgi:di/tricarboxylate transporter